MTTGKTIALTRWIFVGKGMSLLFNMLSRLVITFLPRSKHLLISWLQSPSAVILEPPKIKFATVSTVSPSICHEIMGPDAMILVFSVFSFKPVLSLSFFTLIKRLFSSSSLSAIRVAEEELKNLLMRVKEESEKAGLKLNIKKTKIMASNLITSQQIEVENVEVVTDFLILGSKITADDDCSHETRR